MQFELLELGLMSNGDLALYDKEKGFFKPMDDTKAAALFYAWASVKEKAKPASYFNSLVKKAKLEKQNNKLATVEDRRKQEYLLNVENGVLDLSEKDIKILPHYKSYRFTNCLSFKYVPDAEIGMAPVFKMFVDTSLEASSERIRLLLEIMGACISNYLHFKKAFFLIGETNSGKTVISDQIVRIIGEENVSTIPMVELFGKFATSALVGMQLNLDDELECSIIKGAATFKKLVSMSYMKAESKGANARSFHNFAHLLFCGNALPDFGDFDGSNEALFRKLVVLDFPVITAEENIDHKLSEKLWVERDIIFSLAVKALHRLLQMKVPKFTECPSFYKIKNTYTESAKALQTFVEECCETGDDKRIYISDFLESFKNFCKENALDYKGTPNQIKATVQKINGVEKTKGRMPQGAAKAMFRGIGLNKEYEKYILQDSRN